jgi:hypothetical protein
MAPGAPGMDQPRGLKCRLAAGDAPRRRMCSARMITPNACGARARAAKNVQRSAGMRDFCSTGASLGRADPELVKLNAPVLLPSAPRLARMEAEGAIR